MLIKVNPALIEASYWMVRPYKKFELITPTAAANAMDNFLLKVSNFADVKHVISLGKAINLNGTKTDKIETTPVSLSLSVSTGKFLTSDLYNSLDEGGQAAFRKYFTRYYAALNSIENATLSATNSGEGADTTLLTEEERQARRRLEKAESRFRKLFNSISEDDTGFVPAFMNPLDDEVATYIQKHENSL